MGVMRGKPDQARAEALCDRLKGFDYGLMDLVMQCQDDMTLTGTGELVTMHRALRRLRYRIEAEAGIDPPSGPPPATPKHG